MGTASILTLKTAHRAHTAATGGALRLNCLVPEPPDALMPLTGQKWGRASARKNAFGGRLPHQGWEKRPLDLQSPDGLLQVRHRAKFFLLNFPVGANPFFVLLRRSF